MKRSTFLALLAGVPLALGLPSCSDNLSSLHERSDAIQKLSSTPANPVLSQYYRNTKPGPSNGDYVAVMNQDGSNFTSIARLTGRSNDAGPFPPMWTSDGRWGWNAGRIWRRRWRGYDGVARKQPSPPNHHQSIMQYPLQ